MGAEQPKDDPSPKPSLSVAPRSAMDREVLLPRRSLSIGATGRGDGERRYKLVANIDRGGMGELFLAELHERGHGSRYVVIKRLLADLLDDDKYVQMFVSEADVMSKLNHPNIVRVFDTPIIDGTQCLAMEYVRGRNVQQILARCEETQQKMPPQVVLRIMSQILRGLDYAHNYRLADGTALNLVHRDVTPGNVLVSFEGDTKLTDFGIAKHQMSAVSTTVGIVKGKARYLAPEQILGEQATPRSDIFSASSVVLEMLTNKPVFDRGSVPKTLYAIVNGERDDTEKAIGFRAPLLVQLLNRALHTDPKARLQTAKEVAEGLDAAARLLGKPVDREGVGNYLKDLYRDVEDPLSQFDPALLSLDPPTVHGYSSAEVPASQMVSPGLAAVAAAALANAPDLTLDESAEATTHPPSEPDPAHHEEAHTVTAAANAPSRTPAPQLARMELPPFVAPLSPRAREPIHDPDTAPGLAVPAGLPAVEEESAEARALAALSAHSGVHDPLTHVIRGTPVAPPGQQAQTVDEALAVLAWLQSRRVEPETPGALTPPPQTARALELQRKNAGVAAESERPRGLSDPPRVRPSAAPAQPKIPMAVLFALGAVTGVLATLTLQAVLRKNEVPPKPPAMAVVERVNAVVTPPPEPPVEEEPVELDSAEAESEEEAAAAEEVPAQAQAQVTPEPTEGPPASIDLYEPKGARVRIDGVLIKEKVPLRNLAIRSGKHQVRIFKGKYKHDLSFAIEPGERLDLTRRLRRRTGSK